MIRFVLYSGKGGVGKTTVAAASALRSARQETKTLIVSTDPAHSLSDSFDTRLTGEPTEIIDQLWGVEVDPEAGMNRYRLLFETLAEQLEDAGIKLGESAIAELFTSGVTPGSDELAAIEGLASYADSDRWDRVVFDTAPTGHTLRLLDLPEVMDRGLATALDLREQVRRKVNATRTMLFGPMGAAGRSRSEEKDAFTDTRDRMVRVRETLRDPERTGFRVVTVPETMAVRETERLVSRLRDFEIPITTLVVNRMIEDPGDCERCQGDAKVQETALQQLRESLPELEIWTVPDLPGEVTGLDALTRIADSLPDDEPT